MATDVLQIIQIVSSSIIILIHFYESTSIFNLSNTGTFMQMLLTAIPLGYYGYIPLLLSFIKWKNLIYNIIICFISFQIGFSICFQFVSSICNGTAFYMIHTNIPNFLSNFQISIRLIGIVLAYSICLIKSANNIVYKNEEERYVQIKNRENN